MFKNLSKTTKLFGGLIAVVIIIMIIVISISGNEVPAQNQTHYVNDNASADNKVEALKTMTADLLAVENKNKQLQQSIETFQTQNKQTANKLKQSVADQLGQALKKIQNQNKQKQAALEKQLKENSKEKSETQAHDYPINGNFNGNSKNNDSFLWVSDLSKHLSKSDLDGNSKTTFKNKSLFGLNSHDSISSLLHNNNNPNDNLIENIKKKNPIKPVYTIPMNATLTGATLMTPLVGRIPIDGSLPSPYHFKLVLSARNLTANGYPMPGVHGAVMSGIASGDMLGSCARGDIHSITFIFNDGTISTTEAKGDTGSLGYLSSQTGNPCLAGTFHSNAAIFLGAQMGLAGAEGYASAISSSQYMNKTTPEGGTINTLIGSANKAAIGQGGAAAAEAAQTWWNQRVKNSFDYVYVPNINPKTNKPMKVVVNITQQIPINHDPSARKVNYENNENSLQNNHSKLD